MVVFQVALEVEVEVDLNGNAREIGGLVDKLYGVKRAGVNLALCPIENSECLEKIRLDHPDLEDSKFVVKTVENIWDVLKYALTDRLE